jgi:Pyruvate/2-oxoacid:ferredoxin oxidoreductase delta subunit
MEGDVPQIDYSVCKGCLVCMEECPIAAIECVREEGTLQPFGLREAR